MELQAFVKKVILQIADGMHDVIKEQDHHDIVVNPRMTIGSGDEVRFIPNNLESYKKTILTELNTSIFFNSSKAL